MRLALAALLLIGCGRFGFGEDEPVDATIDATLDLGIVELSNRGASPCVRSGDGRMACWGANDHGQLGRGNTGASGAPGLVPIANVVGMATGENSAFAIDRDGALWGWGANAEGQLGLGRVSVNEQTPQRVELPPVVDVATGEYHTCAIVEQGRELYCWGDNSCGQLGSGDQLPSTSPRKVVGVSGITGITVSDVQTCFVDDSGAAQCMGASYRINNSCQNLRLAPRAPINLPPVVDIQAGCHVSVCAADTSGGAWCWGDDVAGVLGDGLETAASEPSAVATISNITKISTGYNVSCASSSSNAVFCWGDNTDGEVGVNNMTLGQANTPLQVPFFTGMPIDQIESGCATPCVRSGHDIYCWGDNFNTAVDDSAVNVFAPKLRTGLPF